MEECYLKSAERIRGAINRGLHDRSDFRATLLGVPPASRDAWLDLVLGFHDLHDDGPELPRGCVPYLPSSVDVLLRVIEQAAVCPSDVFVDVGSGPGRATTFVHLFTGASAIGLEVQPGLVLAARDLASRLRLSRVRCLEGDAATLTAFMAIGSVFFLYCPFGGDRLEKVLDDLEAIARTRTLRVCCVNLALPPRRWLALEPRHSEDLSIYRSTLTPWSSLADQKPQRA